MNRWPIRDTIAFCAVFCLGIWGVVALTVWALTGGAK